MKIVLCGCALLVSVLAIAQDSTIIINKKIVTLKEAIVRNNLNVPGFIDRVQKDTSFYKAFKNLKIIGYTSLNDIRMLDKKGKIKASLQSRTKQTRHNNCRSMQVLKKKTSGNIYDKNNNWNYYTAELYAGLFLAKDTICGETNIVKDAE